MKLYLRLLVLSLLMLSGRGVASAGNVEVKVGEYITISSAMMTSKAHNQL